jgi:hypothetical protein
VVRILSMLSLNNLISNVNYTCLTKSRIAIYTAFVKSIKSVSTQYTHECNFNTVSTANTGSEIAAEDVIRQTCFQRNKISWMS